MYRRGVTTGSNGANRQLVGDALALRSQLSREQEEMLVDPQTSGGLLLAVPEAEADFLVARLREEGVPAACRVGEVVAGPVALEIV